MEDGLPYQLQISPECINLSDISLCTCSYNDSSSWNSSTSSQILHIAIFVCPLHVANVGYITEDGNIFKYLEDVSLKLLRDAICRYAAASARLLLL